MNRIMIQSEEEPPSWTQEAEDFTLKVLDILKHDGWDLSLFFCTNDYIRQLNAHYRDKDEPTDVLSFTLGESIEENGESRYLPGDIIISLDTLFENAKYFQVSPDEELRRLLIHGILHLSGMDHATNADIEPMLQLQEKLIAELGSERILPWQ